MSNAGGVPRYYLYGDRLEDVELNFIHVERIRDRSDAHDWTIRAHVHPDHVQLLLVERGGGSIRIEDQLFDIPMQCVLVVPTAMIHEIHFEPATDGIVITAARAYAGQVCQSDIRLLDALSKPAVYSLIETGVSEDAVADAFFWTHREYIWSAPGRRMSIMANFLRILVALMRMRTDQASAGYQATDRNYDIMSRYRELLETHFRLEKAMDYYAVALGVSTQRLNQACKQRAGKTASELLHERTIIEAKRYLVYMEMSVAEVGYDLGFDDPAYFSRFFSNRVGQPPGQYRENRALSEEKPLERIGGIS